MRLRRARALWIGAIVSLLVPAVGWAAEGRTPVFAPGTVISAPGKYILTRDLNGTGATPVISISASNVELDLNGFTVSNSGGGTGILVSDPVEVLIRNGNIQSVAVGVDVVSSGAERAVIEDLRVSFATTVGVRVANINNVVVRRVMVYRSFGDGIRIQGSSVTSGQIVDCQVDLAGGQAIAVVGTSSFAVVGNRVQGSTLEGIRIDGCRGCRVEDNTVVSASGGGGGIYLTAVRGGSVSRNSATECGASGIRLGAGSSDLQIRGNVANTNSAHGLLVEGLRFTIEGNVLNDNSGVGLRLAAGGGNSGIGRNFARGNGGAGGGPCAGPPALFPPDSCNDGVANFTFGDNLIPGPALF